MYPKLSSVLIAFDEGERIPNLVLGVLCYTARKKIKIFSVVDANLAPPPRRFLQGPTLGRKLVWTLASLS